jgi:N-acetylglutamate synthase-like GNAT family acetyltransferase
VMGLELRPFQPQDAKLLEGGSPDTPTAGLTVVADGQVVGYGGLNRIAGRHWGFFLIDASERGLRLRAERPRLLHRLVIEALKMCDASGIDEICALCDERHARAAAWLKALGFRPLAEEKKNDDIRAFEAACGGFDTWVRIRKA